MYSAQLEHVLVYLTLDVNPDTHLANQNCIFNISVLKILGE